jgi:hypothetical protein
MTTTVQPGSFIASQGNNNFGPFSGLTIGPGIVAQAQGDNLNLDVAPGGGAGVTALSRGTWVINPTAGNDANTGNASFPLQSNAELSRRLGKGNLIPGVASAVISLIQLISIQYVGNVPASDPLDLTCTLPPNCLLAFVGGATTTRAGTLTAGTVVKAPATNVRPIIEDTVTPPTVADEGERFRITAGANVGQMAWGAKFAAGLLSMSSWSTPTMTPLPDCLIQTGLTSGTAVAGDPYAVETLTQLTLRNVNVKSPFGGTNTTSVVGFVNFDFQNTGGALRQIVNPKDTVAFVYKACRFNGTLVHDVAYGRAVFLNCCFKGPGGAGGQGLVVQRAGPSFRGGLCMGSLVIRNGAVPAFDDDFMTEGGGGFTILGSALFGAIAAFNSTLGGFRIPSNGPPTTASVNTQVGGSGVNRLWGSGNAGGGVEIGTACALAVETLAGMTITGSVPGTNDFILGGAPTARAWDETALAGIGQQTALLVSSWANYVAAIGAGGFLGNAKNYTNQAALLKR